MQCKGTEKSRDTHLDATAAAKTRALRCGTLIAATGQERDVLALPLPLQQELRIGPVPRARGMLEIIEEGRNEEDERERKIRQSSLQFFPSENSGV